MADYPITGSLHRLDDLSQHAVKELDATAHDVETVVLLVIQAVGFDGVDHDLPVVLLELQKPLRQPNRVLKMHVIILDTVLNQEMILKTVR